MVVANSISRDTRVLKEADSLANAGFKVDVIGVADDTLEVFEIRPSGARLHRVNTTRLDLRRSRLLLAPLLGLAKLVAVVTPHRIRRVAAKLLRPSVVQRAIESLLWALSPTLALRVSRQYELQRRLAAHAISLAPDVLHCHDIHTLPVAKRVKSIHACTVVYDAHEIYEDLAQASKRKSNYYRTVHRTYATYVDHFITINDSFAAWYRERYRPFATPHVIMNATRAVTHVNYDGRLHRALGLSIDVKVLLYHGGFAKMRGLERLIRTAATLPEEWTTVLMGWSTQPDMQRTLTNLTTAMNALCRPDRETQAVHLLAPAPLPELGRWASGATIGVIPYEDSGLNHRYCTPNKLWEYPGSGVPIVATKLVEIERLVGMYRMGWILPEQNPTDQHLSGLSQIISSLNDNDLALARMGCAEFMQNESWEKFEERLLRLYADI